MFYSHKFEYKWKTYQNAQTRKRKADPKPKKEKKDHLHNLFGQNTTEDMT